MLEKSLAGKTKEMILLEKHSGKPKGKPLSTNEIIKYYPPSQEELDLHGYTAAEALKENKDAKIFLTPGGSTPNIWIDMKNDSKVKTSTSSE